MLYELQLKAVEPMVPTASALIRALAASSANWQIVADDSLDAYLTTPYGLEIVMVDAIITISLPATYAGQSARDVFEIVWQSVRCLQTLVPVPLFDPQLGRTISPDNPFDVEKVLITYAGLVRHLQSFGL
jgi:hypothetical protein